MTAVIFPTSTIGKPKARSFRGGPQSNVIAFQPSVGPPITRRRSSGVVPLIECTWPALTGAQIEAFEDWFHTNAKDGALPFAWTNPRTDDNGGYKIAPENPPYTINDVGPDNYDLTMNFVKMPGVPWYSNMAPYSAQGVPVFFADFANGHLAIDGVSKVLGDTLSSTRASAATYYDAQGLLKTAAANQIRLTHDPATLESLGLLMEPAATNILLQSADLTNAAWTKNSSVAAASTVASPTGDTDDAFTLTDANDAGSGVANISQALTFTAATEYTFSFYAKAGYRTRVGCQISNMTTPTAADSLSVFDIQAGTVVVEGASVTARIEKVGTNGWHRCSITFTSDAADTAADAQICLVTDAGGTTITRDGTYQVYLYGPMMAAEPSASSYFETTTTTGTRNADTSISATIPQKSGYSYLVGRGFISRRTGGSLSLAGFSHSVTSAEHFLNAKSAGMGSLLEDNSGATDLLGAIDNDLGDEIEAFSLFNSSSYNLLVNNVTDGLVQDRNDTTLLEAGTFDTFEIKRSGNWSYTIKEATGFIDDVSLDSVEAGEFPAVTPAPAPPALAGEVVLCQEFSFDPSTDPQSSYEITGLSNVVRIDLNIVNVGFAAGASSSVAVRVKVGGTDDSGASDYAFSGWQNTARFGATGGAFMYTGTGANVYYTKSLIGLTDQVDSSVDGIAIAGIQPSVRMGERSAEQVEDGITIFTTTAVNMVSGRVFGCVWYTEA